jgi:hypothetical protein
MSFSASLLIFFLLIVFQGNRWLSERTRLGIGIFLSQNLTFQCLLFLEFLIFIGESLIDSHMGFDPKPTATCHWTFDLGFTFKHGIDGFLREGMWTTLHLVGITTNKRRKQKKRVKHKQKNKKVVFDLLLHWTSNHHSGIRTKEMIFSEIFIIV